MTGAASPTPDATGALPSRTDGAVLGFDFGTRRIGVAVGQTVTGTAAPLTTLEAVRARPDWTGCSRSGWRPPTTCVPWSTSWRGTAPPSAGIVASASERKVSTCA